MTLEIKALFRKNTKEIIVLSLIALLVMFGLFQQNHREKRLLKNPKFTIGTISSQWHSKGTFKPPGKDLNYFVKGRIYISTIPVSKDRFKIGDRFLIMYDSIKPNPVIGFFDSYPVADSIETPENGWKLDEIPFGVDKNKLNKMVDK